MNKKTVKSSGEDGEELQARLLHWRRVRRRFVGAAAVFLLIGLLWGLGEDSRAPVISPAAVPEIEPPPLTPGAEIEAAEAALAEEYALEREESEESGGDEEDKPADAEDSQEPAGAPDGELAAEPGEELTAEPDGESAAEPDEELTAEPAEESAEEPAEELAAEPAEPAAGTVEKPAAETPEESADIESAIAEGKFPPYAVQVGYFSEQWRARRLALELREKMLTPYVKKFNVGGVWFWRVYAAGYPTKAAAQVAAKKLKEKYRGAFAVDLS